MCSMEGEAKAKGVGRSILVAKWNKNNSVAQACITGSRRGKGGRRRGGVGGEVKKQRQEVGREEEEQVRQEEGGMKQ